MLEILSLVLLTHIVALAIPGPDFFLVVRASLVEDIRYCVAVVLGIALGVLSHFLFSILFLRVLQSQAAFFFQVLQVFGCIYLTYLAISSWVSSYQRLREQKKDEGLQKLEMQLAKQQSDADNNSSRVGKKRSQKNRSQAFVKGLLTNLLNPKVVMYFMGILSVLVDTRAMGFGMIAALGVNFFVLTFLWFFGIARILIHFQLKVRLEKGVAYVEAVAGVLFFSFAVRFLLEVT